MKRKITYRQTRGGMYCSIPEQAHLEAALGGDWTWSREFYDRGHGEYVRNVEVWVEAMKIKRTGEELVVEVVE